MQRSRQEIPRSLGPVQHPATLAQSRFKHLADNLVQGVAQDIFILSEEIDAIRDAP
jgi:hypothetical protein